MTQFFVRILALTVFLSHVSVFAQQTPETPAPVTQLKLPKFFEIYRLQKGQRKYHHLTQLNEEPSEKTMKLTAPKVLADVICVENMIQKQIFERYKKQYGVDRSDLIGLDQIGEGFLSLQAETSEELHFLQNALRKIEEACFQEFDPVVDGRPVDEQSLLVGEYRPTIRPYQVTARLEAFRDETNLAPNESVRWDPERELLVYKVTQAHYDLLYEFVKPQLSFLPVLYRHNVVRHMVTDFFNSIRKEKRSWENLYMDNDGVSYLLTKRHRDQLEDIVTKFDRPPYQLVVEVQMLSVSREHIGEISTFFHSLLSSDPTKSVDILPGIFDDPQKLIRLKLATPKLALDYALKAISNKGLGSRASDPEFKTTEFYDGLPPPTNRPIVEKKVVTPIQNILQNQVVTKEVEVGLGIKINQLKVIESVDFNAKLANFQWRLGNFTNSPKNRELIQKMGDALRQERFTDISLEELEKFSRIGDSFDAEYRSLLRELELNVDIEVEDGGILRTVENQQSINVIYDKFVYKNSLRLRNRETAFIAGTSQNRTGVETKSIPILENIPGLGWLFKSQKKTSNVDTVVAFLTVTIADDLTDESLAGKYGFGAMRESIPVGLGGYSIRGVEHMRLRTGASSTLPWMYKKEAGEVYYKAREKLSRGSTFPRTLASVLFYKRLLIPLQKDGIISDEDWLNFSVVKDHLDHLEIFDSDGKPINAFTTKTGFSHPALPVLDSIREDLKKVTRSPETPGGIALSNAEILALVRHTGVIGRSYNPTKSDDRLLMYLAYVSAKADPNERQVFKSDAEIAAFERIQLPGFIALGCDCKMK